MKRERDLPMFGRVRPRFAALVALSLTLMSLGPCATIAIESAIDGLFDAVNPVVIDYVGGQLSGGPTGS